MRLLYVNPETGEASEEPVEGWLPLDAFEEAPPESDTAEDDSWIGDYVTRSLVAIEAEEEALSVQFERLMSQLKAKRKRLEYLYNDRLQALVAQLLMGSKKKSVDFMYGRVGKRQRTSIDIVDQDALIEWAAEHAPEAMVYPRPYVRKSDLPTDLLKDLSKRLYDAGEDQYALLADQISEASIPGIDVRTEDVWYVKPAKRKED